MFEKLIAKQVNYRTKKNSKSNCRNPHPENSVTRPVNIFLRRQKNVVRRLSLSTLTDRGEQDPLGGLGLAAALKKKKQGKYIVSGSSI